MSLTGAALFQTIVGPLADSGLPARRRRKRARGAHSLGREVPERKNEQVKKVNARQFGGVVAVCTTLPAFHAADRERRGRHL